jgi:hypothetical protein
MGFSKSYDPRTWVDPNAPAAAAPEPVARQHPRDRRWLGYLLAAVLLAGGAAGAYVSRPDTGASAS